MRKIKGQLITDTVAMLCIDANYNLPKDIREAIKNGCALEKKGTNAKEILERLIENADIAKNEEMAICQDTGMAIVFVEIGQNVFVEGGLTDAIQKGVAKGYAEGYLRKSIVKHPLNRVNTGDNTPAVIHYNIVEGDSLKITVAPKGFGSENMSGVKMLKPSDGYDGVVQFVVETVKNSGSNPCPPIVVGVGIGGSMEKAALMAKEALLLPLDETSQDEIAAKLESELLDKINQTDIGPMGLGGKTTALGVKVITYPTHIAGLPVAVNISCHVTRHSTAIL